MLGSAIRCWRVKNSASSQAKTARSAQTSRLADIEPEQVISRAEEEAEAHGHENIGEAGDEAQLFIVDRVRI